MSVRSTITSELEQVASKNGITLAPLADDLPLQKIGLDSLGIAVVVARLEEVMGVDPFDYDATEFPLTFGDLVRLYESAAG